MDLLDLKSTVTTLDTQTLPEAAQLANGVLTNAAALLSGTVNNAAVLLANLLSGVEGERLLAMSGFADLLKPVTTEWARTNDQLARLNDLLDRLTSCGQPPRV